MESKKRLTASNFGSLITRKEHIQPKSILKRICTKEKIKSATCDWGIQNEKKAFEEYAIKLNLNKTKLENVGLIINPRWPWLGASPDALVDSDKVQLFEVKCPSTK